MQDIPAQPPLRVNKESACNAGDPASIPSVWKIPRKREWLPTPVFLSGKIPWTEEPGGLQFMDRKESDTTEHLTV